MEKDEILSIVNQLINDILDEDSIVLQYESTAKDVDGWDSLTHIELIVAMEKKFKLKFTSREILSWKNVNKMVDCIYLKMKG